MDGGRRDNESIGGLKNAATLLIAVIDVRKLRIDIFLRGEIHIEFPFFF